MQWAYGRGSTPKHSAQVKACTDLLYSKIAAKLITGSSILLDTIYVDPRETEKMITQCVCLLCIGQCDLSLQGILCGSHALVHIPYLH